MMKTMPIVHSSTFPDAEQHRKRQSELPKQHKKLDDLFSEYE